MIPAYSDQTVTLWHGDCLTVLRELPDCSVDSVCTDPPYSLSFMSAKWDTHASAVAFQQWCAAWAAECLRVLRPGGHLLAFGGSRTYHRMTSGVEDAGFEIRDCITWHFGSGFPKSLDVSKAIDRAAPRAGMFDAFAAHFRESRAKSGLTQKDIARHFPSKTGGLTGCVWNWENGANVPTRAQWEVLAPMLGLMPEWLPLIERVEAERQITGKHLAAVATGDAGLTARGEGKDRRDIPATPAAEQWQGWGTALKPATEFIVVARKPLSGTVAANVTTWGTGALNIDGCRVGEDPGYSYNADRNGTTFHGEQGARAAQTAQKRGAEVVTSSKGRWPANVVLDSAMAEVLDQQSGESVSLGGSRGQGGGRGAYGVLPAQPDVKPGFGDMGGASRFFYVARWDADEQRWHLPIESLEQRFIYTPKADASERPRVNGVSHSTVKPLALMRWLVRLVTPPGGTVLEPFAGSGTTVEACIVEGFRCIAIERETEYLPLIEARITRRRDPVRAIELAGEDLGLFGIEEVS